MLRAFLVFKLCHQSYYLRFLRSSTYSTSLQVRWATWTPRTMITTTKVTWTTTRACHLALRHASSTPTPWCPWTRLAPSTIPNMITAIEPTTIWTGYPTWTDSIILQCLPTTYIWQIYARWARALRGTSVNRVAKPILIATGKLENIMELLDGVIVLRQYYLFCGKVNFFQC